MTLLSSTTSKTTTTTTWFRTVTTRKRRTTNAKTKTAMVVVASAAYFFVSNACIPVVTAFVSVVPSPIISRKTTTTAASSFSILSSSNRAPTTDSKTILKAKKRKNQQERQDMDQFNRWYDKVDEDATPDDIFWEEMERQKYINSGSGTNGGAKSVGAPNGNGENGTVGGAGGAAAAIDPFRAMASSSFTSSSSPLSSSPSPAAASSSSNAYTPPIKGTMSDIAEERSSEAVLASYANYMVDDNWLDERYLQLFDSDEDFMMEMDLDEHKAMLDKQLDELEEEEEDDRGVDGAPRDDGPFGSRGSRVSGRANFGSSGGNEPWDNWGKERSSTGDGDGSGSGMDDEDDDEDNDLRIRMDPAKAKTAMAKEFLLDYTDTDDYDKDNFNEEKDEETLLTKKKLEEEEHLERLSWIKIRSPRLENARRNSEKSKPYFQRPPNQIEGFDTMWVSAIDNACLPNLVGSFRNYGIEFADNFGDWVDTSPEDGYRSIEDIASFKARKVYEVTGLPCIASRTSFEIEPVRPINNPNGPPLSRAHVNPRVTSGYRFNDITNDVDYILDAIKPFSDPSRVTRFRSCFCFYDGDMEIFDYGELDCDIYFANSMRTYIPMSSGINELGKTLQLTFGFEYQKWLKAKVREALGGTENRASIKLRDRVLKEGKVLPNDIIDVSTFMDSKVDVDLMDECGRELAQRFEKLKPNKILTVATTGLVIAIPVAKYLQVPVVYARKERNIVMSNTWQASYSSKTVGKNRELLVSKSHIEDGDRILIIDDFLSSGSSQEALLRIVSDSEAHAVGVGVVLEKVYDAGRQALSGFNVPVESLARIASVSNGVITMIEEEGYTKM